jgi:hypothetical protein
MGKSKAPKPTDPAVTAAAQGAMNLDTALTQSTLNMQNQVGPDGSITYSQDGTRPVYQSELRDQNGNVIREAGYIDLPSYTQTTQLSPEQQAIKTEQDAASLNLASLGNQLSGTLGNQLTDNFSLGDPEREAKLIEMQRMRLDPQLNERLEALRTQLTNQGIRQGSDAYDRAISRFDQTKTDAYNQLALDARGQINNELLTEDNQRINQIGALLSGGQVSQPMFGSTSGAGQLANVDYAGLVSNYDQGMFNRWQTDQQNKQVLLGGVLGLGAGALSGGYL